MLPLKSEIGITVKQLKELVKDLPEINENGEDFEVWLEHYDNCFVSDVCKSIWKLNQGDVLFCFKQ